MSKVLEQLNVFLSYFGVHEWEILIMNTCACSSKCSGEICKGNFFTVLKQNKAKPSRNWYRTKQRALPCRTAAPKAGPPLHGLRWNREILSGAVWELSKYIIAAVEV